MLNAIHLTKSDIAKLEEALNCDDLEVMVSVVDRIVQRRLAKVLKVTSHKPSQPDRDLGNADWLKKPVGQADPEG